jgi:sigma-B regulation protein RsbU (phosphoserine phosphatase)
MDVNNATVMPKSLADAQSLVDTVNNFAEELRMAGLVQRDFLPTSMPDCDKFDWGTVFIPAEWVSGDIYDVSRIDEDHVGFYVADVVGHGMPAALLTMFLKQALIMRQTTGNSYEIFPPSEVLRNLNLRITEQKLSGNQFATCCCCLMNIKTLELTYSRAGHPYPVLLRKGMPPQQLESQGSLLGIFEQAVYEQNTIQLEEGDKLIIYSDGAEPYIGAFDDSSGFGFTSRFKDLAKLDMKGFTANFNEIIHDQKVNPSGCDDITMLGLEIKEK